MVANKLNSISVFLIKRSDFKNFKDLTVGGISGPISLEGGELFYKTNDKTDYPEWIKRFFGEERLGKGKDKLKTKALSAVYFTTIDYKGKDITFAVAFGYGGRYLINKDYIQPDFGLETSSHAIDPTKIGSIRTTTYDSSIKDKEIRSVVDIKQSEYFLNENTDVLTSVSGKARNKGPGDLLKNRTIGGRDSVSMTAYVDVKNLKEFLNQLYEQYVSTGEEGVTYKSNIRKIVEADEIDKAKSLLQNAINNYKSEENLYLNLPVVVLGEKNLVTGYTIEGSDYGELITDILDNYKTIDQLTNTTVTIKEAIARDKALEFPLFDFLYAELKQKDFCYILASGVFYKISNRYKEQVDNFYKDVDIKTFSYITAWDGGNEGNFNKNQKSDRLLVMDEEFVYPGNRDRFELCDLMTDDKHLIHVKIFGVASQPLGHLFNQGMLSAQCLADAEIRTKIQGQIKKVQKNAGKVKDFSVEPGFKEKEYTVTFLLLCGDKVKYEKGTQGDRPKIPFMAKAVFNENCKVIRSLGYNVCLAFIKKKEIV